MPGNNLKYADKFAKDYDKSVLHNNWNGPKIIFKDTKQFIPAQSLILDLGIGTGESSKPFQQEGHTISGVDGSGEMLEQCRIKKIGTELIRHDLEKFPYPLSDKFFDVIISNGVFHLIYPLEPIVAEAQRLLKPEGIFAFTFENTDDVSESKQINSGIWERITKSGVYAYKYSNSVVLNYLKENNFIILNQTKFLAFTNQKIPKDIYFNAIVARLLPNQL